MKSYKNRTVIFLYCLLLFILACTNQAQDLSKKEAFLDIGSGSTKFILVTSLKGEKPTIRIERTPILFEKNLTEDKKFPKEIEQQGQTALKNFAEMAKKEGAILKGGGATAAFRNANPEYIEGLFKQWSESTGWKLKVLTQEEEAISGYYAVQMLQSEWDTESSLVWDMGGGSLQVICKRGTLFFTTSYPWGAVPVSKFLRQFAPGERPDVAKVTNALKEELLKDPLCAQWKNHPDTKVFAIGGVVFGLSKLVSCTDGILQQSQLLELEKDLRPLSASQVEEKYPSSKSYGAEMWPNTIAVLTWMDLLQVPKWKILKVEMGAGLGHLEFFK